MNNDQNKASGVTYVDRLTRQVKEVRAKAVILCAQALESTRILLNSPRTNIRTAWRTRAARSVII